MINEQEKVLNNFTKVFGARPDKRLVLYGLGVNTEYIIKHCPKGIQIVGLMDAQNEGKTFWGYPVLSADDVIGRADIIVVVARVSVLNVIFNRICSLADKIPICNTAGVQLKELFSHDTGKYIADPVWHVTPKQIYEEIDEHDVISCDIFDTILMRRVLLPEDIFTLAERTIKTPTGYAQKRREAEAIANAKIEAPNIDEIYEELALLCGKEDFSAEELKEIEFETEKENLVVRGEVLRLLEYAKARRKKVVLLSDMYWPKWRLQILLETAGIVPYDDIIVSCEYHQTKETGALYRILKEKYGTDILHIGDNEIADIRMAKANDVACQQLLSAREMLLHSPLQQLLVHIKTMADKNLLGAFLSEVLNNPFALTDTKGILRIDNGKMLARWCFAPLIAGFLDWILKKVHGKKRDNTAILFTARDGYLFKRLYDKAVAGKETEFPESIYFHTSRRAVSVANIRGKSDIRFIAENLHSAGKLGDILVRHFGVMASSVDTEKETVVTTPKDIETVYSYLLRYEDEIFHHASEERDEYLTYVDSLHLTGKSLYIFDLVCEGSVPHGIETLLNRNGTLLALGTLNIPNRYYVDESRVLSYLGNQGQYDIGYNTFRYYKLLEMIAAPHEGSLKCFHEGQRDLDAEVVGTDIFKNVEIIQDEIVFAVERFLKYCQQDEFTVAVLDVFLGLVSSKYSDTKGVENIFWHEDPSVGEKLYPAWDSIVD